MPRTPGNPSDMTLRLEQTDGDVFNNYSMLYNWHAYHVHPATFTLPKVYLLQILFH